jgi:hypothetical protein
MAPESIANRNYSKKSDVWMFGIVVWGPVRYLLVVSLDRFLYGVEPKPFLGNRG